MIGIKTFLSSISSADSKADYLSDLRGLSKPIHFHLFKILSIHNTEAEQHWLAEVDGWLIQANYANLKSKVSSREIFKALHKTTDFKMLKRLVWVNKYMKNGLNSKTISIYNNYAKAWSFYHKILDEFSRDPLNSFVSIENLNSFKDAIAARGEGYTTYDLKSVLKA